VEPYSRKRDEKVAKMAKDEGLEIEACDDLMIQPPGKVQRAAGGPYTVFTPYSRASLAFPPHDPLPRPAKLSGISKAKGISLPDLKGLGLDPCDIPLPPAGEKAAQQLLKDFTSKNLRRYDSIRNFPLADGTSRLSPHLRFGTISVRTVLATARRARADDPSVKKQIDVFVSELIWRDFYKQIL